MKKIITLFALLTILFINVYSQSNFSCDNKKDWDWTLKSSYNSAYINGVGEIALSSPFHTTSSTDKTLTNIIRGKDYLPSEGWVLLRKEFGCPEQNSDTKFPYFILYNKYRGIMRLFIFNGSSHEYKQAAIIVNWDYETDNTSLFAPSEVIQSPNKDYHDGKKVSNEIVNYVHDYYASAWFVTDIPVTFDHLLDYTKDFYLRVTVNSSITSTIDLKSRFMIESPSIIANLRSENYGVYEFSKQTIDILSKISSQDEFKRFFDNYNKVKGVSKGEIALQKMADKMGKDIEDGKFQEYFSTYDGVISMLNSSANAGLGLVNYFMGKSNKNAISSVQLMPMVSNGEGVIYGQFTTTANATSFPLQLPATNHYYQSNDLNYDGLPIYDCPLGVISLEESPTLKTVRTFSKVIESHGNLDQPTSDYKSYEEITNYTELALSSAIKLAHNVSSDTEVIDVKAQLIAKSPFPYDAKDRKGKEIYKRINKGEYMLLDVKNDVDNKSYTYATKIVDIENLKNQKIIIPNWVEIKQQNETNSHTQFNSPLLLKLFITMKPTDTKAGQTPILYIATYRISGDGTKDFAENGKTLQINRYFENCDCYKKNSNQ